MFIGVLLGTLLLSSTAAYLLAGEKCQERLRKMISGENAIEVHASSWDTAFKMHNNVLVDVGVQLKSGAWVSGQLYTYDPAPDGTPHRSLVLSGDVQYRQAESSTTHKFVGYDVLTVDSESIEYMAIGYQAEKDAESTKG